MQTYNIIFKPELGIVKGTIATFSECSLVKNIPIPLAKLP